MLGVLPGEAGGRVPSTLQLQLALQCVTTKPNADSFELPVTARCPRSALGLLFKCFFHKDKRCTVR
jgi:uncharacterized protein (DUF983 family)